MEIKKGQLIAITNGEYSDYTLRDHVRALKDFDSKNEAQRFMDEGDFLAVQEWDKDGDPTEYGSDDRFIAWAIREGLIEPLGPDDVVELWIGSYGRLKVA